MLLLIPLFPLLGFVANAMIGRRLPKAVSGGLACLVMVGSFVVSALSVWQLAALEARDRLVQQTAYTWIASGDFVIDLTLSLDPLSAVMILVVTGIGSLIHIYSTAYMHEETDSRFRRGDGHDEEHDDLPVKAPQLPTERDEREVDGVQHDLDRQENRD